MVHTDISFAFKFKRENEEKTLCFFTLSKRIRPKMTILLANRQLYFSPSPPTQLLCTKTQDRLRLYQTAITTISKQLIALLLVWFCMKKKLYPKPAELETHFFEKAHRVLVDSLRTGSPAPTVQPTMTTVSFHILLSLCFKVQHQSVYNSFFLQFNSAADTLCAPRCVSAWGRPDGFFPSAFSALRSTS